MNVGALGRVLVVSLIDDKKRVSRADLRQILQQREVRFELGPGVELDDFLTWSVREGGLLEEEGTLQVSSAGKCVLQRLRSEAVRNALLTLLASQQKAGDSRSPHRIAQA